MTASTSSLPAAATRASTSSGVPQIREMRWSVRLLGAVEAVGNGQTLGRWPSRAVAALLARLALAPDRAHPREELIELLWPGVSIDIGRNRLRQALSTLKGLLEPPGPQAVSVLRADRMSIHVQPGMIECDALQFERLLRAGDDDRARALYRAELMPGFYDDWVIAERQRLTALFEQLDPTLRPRMAAPASIAQASLADASIATVAAITAATPAPTGLPSYWTRIFGVELTASRLCAMVAAQRLVTVLGPGGSGKTRLAVEAAQALRDAPEGSIDGASAVLHFDRIAFVPLVNCTEPAQALEAICDSLNVDRSAAARGSIVTALAGRRALLVLDNLEQLAADAGAEIAELLAAVPGLHVLVTSRRLLEIDGECAFELEGLVLPEPEAALDAAAVNPAVALFVDRARAARADFILGARNTASIVELVRLLGGMPLAIELAASRVRSLTPQELLQRLRQQSGTPMLDLLARNAPRASCNSRHASMRHVVAWSWQQLTPPQAAMLQTLSVFAAPARTQAVAAAAALEVAAAQLLLNELSDASLLQPVEGPDGVTRYALLQPVREFAAERLTAAQGRATRQRLRQWLTAFAADAVVRSPAALVPEMVHVHAAILSAAGDGAWRQALELAVTLRTHWDTDVLPLTSLLALEHALAELNDDATLRCDALELLANGRGAAGFMDEAVGHAEAALALAGDDRRRSLALVRWVWAMYYAGSYARPQAAARRSPSGMQAGCPSPATRERAGACSARARPHEGVEVLGNGRALPFEARFDAALDEANMLARRSGDLTAQASVLHMRALVACNFRLDFAGAEALSADAQQLWERLGNRRMVNQARVNRATMWAWLGRNVDALEVFDEGERLAQAGRDWVLLMRIQWQQGRVLIRLRRWHDAVAAFRRSIQLAWQRQHAQGLANALLHLPEALVMSGQAADAARLQGFAVANWSRTFHSINRIEARELRRTRLLLHLRLGAARAESLRVEGSGLAPADAVALALAVTNV